MKQIKMTAFLLCLIMLCACGANQQDDGSAQENDRQEQQSDQTVVTSEPVYAYEDQLASRQFIDEESGNIYASYSYSVPMMYIANVDHLTEDALAIAQRNMEAFNAKMQEVFDNAVAFGEENAQELEGGYFAMPAADEKKLTITQTGQIITVWVNGYFYGGGAHPHAYVDSYTFDLAAGQFIDPAQIGDAPDVFRAKTAVLLVAQAESLGEEYTEGFWADYAEIIGRWNDTAVRFDEDGMRVVFSPYELGPYAMGPVELFLTYEELAEAIGEGGLERLGVTSP